MAISSTSPAASIWPPTSPAATLDGALARELLCLRHCCVDAVDEVKRRLGAPALWRRPVRPDDHVVDPARWRAAPAVRQVEDVAADDRHSDLVPVGPGEVVGRLRHRQLPGLVERDVTAGHPVEQRAGLVVFVRDEAVHRHTAVHDHLAHGPFRLCSDSAHAGAAPWIRRSMPTRGMPRAGLEPATRGLEGRCSIQLSYRGV